VEFCFQSFIELKEMKIPAIKNKSWKTGFALAFKKIKKAK
jgi:hypothetical protein